MGKYGVRKRSMYEGDYAMIRETVVMSSPFFLFIILILLSNFNESTFALSPGSSKTSSPSSSSPWSPSPWSLEAYAYLPGDTDEDLSFGSWPGAPEQLVVRGGLVMMMGVGGKTNFFWGNKGLDVIGTWGVTPFE